MKDNSLIKYQEGFFAKLKRKFRSLFIKKVDNIKIEENKETTDVKIPKPINTILATSISDASSKSKIDKNEFFDLYNKIIKKEIDIKTVDPDTLKDIYKILEEEARLKRNILAQKIKILEEKKELIKKITNE